MIRFSTIATLTCLTILCAPFIAAEERTIETSHTYLMGDSDSKNDARRLCFIEAKRKAIEQLGTIVTSKSTVKDYRLSSDEINTFSAALVKVETVNEEWKFIGSNMAVEIYVQVVADVDNVIQQLETISQDNDLKTRIEDQQKKISDLESKFKSLISKNDNSEESAFAIRKEKTAIVSNIDALEEKKIVIHRKVIDRTRSALELIERGMTKSEVKELIGYPPGQSEYSDCWQYGNILIAFSNETVECLLYAGCASFCHCQGYVEQYERNCIAK